MPEIDAHDEVVPPEDAYLDDFLALGQDLPDRWSETRVDRVVLSVEIIPEARDVTCRLIIWCCLVAPAVDGRPTVALTKLSGKWDPIDNLFVPKYDRLLCREQGQTMRCQHMYGSPGPDDRPFILVDEANGGRNWVYESNYWVPISHILECVFRNPPVVR
jgi:hypothetical protein